MSSSPTPTIDDIEIQENHEAARDVGLPSEIDRLHDLVFPREVQRSSRRRDDDSDNDVDEVLGAARCVFDEERDDLALQVLKGVWATELKVCFSSEF